MNDFDAAFKQQLEKLKDGGELQVEYGGLMLRILSAHGIFIIMAETYISFDRLYDVLKMQQYDLQQDEQYLMYENRIYYCLFLKEMDFSSVINRIYVVVKRSMEYR